MCLHLPQDKTTSANPIQAAYLLLTHSPADLGSFTSSTQLDLHPTHDPRDASPHWNPVLVPPLSLWPRQVFCLYYGTEDFPIFSTSITSFHSS